MAIAKKYYSLDEAALMIGCTPNDLVHLGAQDSLPVYVFAENWSAHVWAKNITDSDNDELMLVSPPRRPAILNELVQLQVGTLIKYEFSSNVTTSTFSALNNDPSTEAADFHTEYRLCNSNDPMQSMEINLRDYKLIIRHTDILNLKQSKGNVSLEESNLSNGEREKLLKMIGLLAILLGDHKKGKFLYGENPNVNQISNSIIELYDMLIEKNASIETKGLGKSNIREYISKGIKLLTPK